MKKLSTTARDQQLYAVRLVNRLPKALREELVKWHGDVLIKKDAA
ncbi:hypothetical protein [Rhizobium sp. 42MFCr.1]|nr:hypothetical protein [Rhizobium sp. 42MFCr.1]